MKIENRTIQGRKENVKKRKERISSKVKSKVEKIRRREVNDKVE